MNWLSALRKFWKGKPQHLKRGRVGENAARGHLEKLGLKFLTANFSTRDGEIDLIFRDQDCLLFVLFTRNI